MIPVRFNHPRLSSPSSLDHYRARLGKVWRRTLGALLLGGGLGVSGAALATTTINHSFTGAVINQGDTSVYQITVTNDDLVALSAANVTVFLDNTSGAPDTSGNRVTLVSGTPISNTCNFTVSSAVAGSSKLVLTNGTIPAGTVGTPSQCVFSLAVTSTTPGTYHAFIPANQTPSSTHAGYQAVDGSTPVNNSTNADITLQVNSLLAPTGTKSYSPTTAVAGDPVRLTVALSNPNSGSTMPLTTFTDNLPSDGSGDQMVIAPTPNATVACTGTGASNGSVSATAGATSFTLTGGTIGQSGTCTVQVNVVVPTVSGTSQTLTNTLPAGAIGNTRGLSSNSFQQNLTVSSPISVSKSIATSPISAGQATLMTLTITNSSTTHALPITSFSDNLTGTTLRVLTTASSPVAAASNPSVTCDGSGASNGSLSYTADAADTTVTLTGATAGIKSGALGKCVITAYVTSNIDGTHTNTIPANAVQNPSNFASPSASANLITNAQLTVNKTVSLASVGPGQWALFTVTINNWSGGTVTNVSFVDILPHNGSAQMVVFNKGSGIYSTDSGCTGGTWTGTDASGVSTGSAPVSGTDAGIRWTGGSIVGGAGASPGVCTISFYAQVPASATSGMTLSNQITATSVTGDGPNGAVTNPAASPAANITVVDNVVVSKGFSPSSVAQGAQSTLTITVRNRIASALTAVNLTDNLPAGLTLAANPAATNGCGGTLQAYSGDNKVVLTGGTVAARPDASTDTQCQITVKVTGSTTGSYTNTIAPADFSSSGGTISGNATASLTITGGITGSKSFSPSAVAAGGVSRVTITVTNSDSSQLTGVNVPDTLPANLTVANPANASATCANAVVTANPGAGSATMQGATLAAGSSCQFSFDVLAGGSSGNWVNTLGVGSITSAEGASNTAAITATLTRQSAAQVNINKSFSPVVVTGGVPSTLTLTLSNPSGITLHGISVTDVFPTGIQVYSVPSVTTTCNGATISAAPGDGKVTIKGVTMAAGGSCQVQVQTTSVKFLNLTNSIPANAITSDEGYTNPSLVSATLSTLQGLGLMKAFSPAYVTPNTVTSLKMWLVSTFDPNAPTPLTLTGVTYTDNLPAGVVVAATPNTSTTCPGTGSGGNATITAAGGATSVVLTNATIAPGTLCEIDVDVVAPGSTGAYINTIPSNSISTDQGPTNNNSATATLYVVQQPTISKSFANTKVIAPGGSNTLTVTINNGATVPITGVSLTDTLPSGLAIATTPAATTTCSGGTVNAAAGTDTLSLSGATVPAGGSCTFSANVTGSASGSYINNIPASSLSSNEGLTNPGAASDTLNIRSAPTVAKAFNPTSISAGGTSTLTITLGNTNASALTLSSALVDALPGGMTVAATPNVVKTCPGTVTAAAGSTTVTYANGGSIPAGGCTISLSVTASTAGLYTNIIAAGQLTTNGGPNPDPAYADLGVGGSLARPTLDKEFAPGSIAIGGTSTLTITLGNPNASALTLSSNLTDNLPANVTVAGATGGTCAGVSTTATSVTVASGSTIPAGGCTVTVPVTSSVGGSYTNVLAAGALVTDGGSNPQPTQANLVVQALTPPTVGKSFNLNTINPGGTSVLSISLGNSNGGSITLSSDLVDTFPAGVVIAATPSLSTTCPGSWTGAAGGNTLTYPSGAAIPAGGCAVQVTVTAASSAGSPYVNTIPAGALVTGAGSNGAAASATLFVNPPQPPSLTKSFSKSRIGLGQTATLTVSLGNGNASAITLTSNLVDTLPANLVVATPNNLSSSAGCTAASVSAPAGGTTVTYASGGTIPANGGCTISVDVTSSTAGSYTNTLAVGALATTAGNNAVATSATLVVAQVPTLSKSFSPAIIPVNGSSTLTLTLGNTNAYALTLNAALVDTLPSGVVVGSPATVGGTCASANVVAVAGGSTVTFKNGATLPAGGCTITVPVTSATAAVYTNTIPAGGLSVPEGSNATPATANLSVLAPPTLSKTFSPTAISKGANSTLTISLGNPNTLAMTLTSAFTDTLPSGLVVGTGAVGGTCTSASVTATTGSGAVTYASGAQIPVGGCTITVPVTSSTSGTYVNTIAASALSTNGGNPATGTSANLLVSIEPGVTKAFSPATINPGDISRLTITLSNPNVADMTLTAAMTDTLPTNVTVATVPNVSKTCPGTVTTTSGSITYASGSVIPNGACTIQVDVTSVTNAGSPYTNTIPVGGVQTSAGNNSVAATAQLTVNPLQPVSITKTFAPTTMGVGDLSTLTLALRNNNANATTLTANLVDTLPAGLVIANPPNVVVTSGCDAAHVQAVAGGATLTYTTGAPLPANAGCSISVAVTSSTAGNYVNTIPANSLTTVLGNFASPTSASLLVGVKPTLAKSFSPAALPVGQTSTLTLTLGNGNGYAVTLTSPLVDNLPANLVVASPATIGGSCSTANVVATAGSSAVSYPLGASIPPGGCTITVPVTSATAGGYTNVLAAGALATSSGSNGAGTSARVDFTTAPTVGKSFDSAQIQPGSSAVLTITLGNSNAVGLTLASAFTDTLPTGMTVDAAPDLAGTCDLSRVTAVAKSGAVTLGAGAVIPAGGCTIKVRVTVSDSKEYTNVIPAGALVTVEGGSNPSPAQAKITVIFIGIPTLDQWGRLLLALVLMVLAAPALGRVVGRR